MMSQLQQPDSSWADRIGRAALRQSTGFFADKMEAGGPSYLSAAVLYESLVCDSYKLKDSLPFPLVSFYPKEGTFWSDHPVGIVQRPWVTDEQKGGGEGLHRLPAGQAAAGESSYATVSARRIRRWRWAAPISADFGADPKEPQDDAGSSVSRRDERRSCSCGISIRKRRMSCWCSIHPGSMNDDNKMINAKAGAAQLLTQLDDADTLSLLPFSGEMRWSGQEHFHETSRQRATGCVNNLIADGGTRLYDSIDAAVQYLAA